MAKFMSDASANAMLDFIATATRMSVCSAQPANFAGIAAVSLANVTMTAGNGNDYTHSDVPAGGRRTTVAQKANITVNTSGDATHIVLDDGTQLIYGTTCATQALASGGTTTVPSWNIDINDPT